MSIIIFRYKFITWSKGDYLERSSGERGGKDSIIENEYDIHTQYEYNMTYTVENIIMKSVILYNEKFGNQFTTCLALFHLN